jgi:hypothetical protein
VLSHVAPAHLLEHERLPLLVRGRGIGLGDVERDLAGAKRVGHDGREGREPQPSFDEPDGEPEPPGDALDVGALLDQLLEGEALVGRVHGEPLEVLREPGLLRRGRSAVDYEAANLVIDPQLALFGETGERPEAAAARLDGEAPLRLLRGGNHEVLQKPPRLDVRLQLKVSLLVGGPPHVAR